MTCCYKYNEKDNVTFGSRHDDAAVYSSKMLILFLSSLFCAGVEQPEAWGSRIN